MKAKKIWMTLFDDRYKKSSRWYIEVDFGVPMIFEELDTPLGKRIGFRQIKKRWYQFWK